MRTSIPHTLKSTPTADARLKSCPICGAAMLGRFKSGYSGPAWIFSCSSEDCILHRNSNNIRIAVSYNPKTKKTLTEQDAIDLINERAN